MEKKIKQFIGKIIDLRLAVLIIGILITVFLAYEATQIRLYDDPNKWPPSNHPYVVLNETIKKDFGGTNVVIVQLTVREGDIFNPTTLFKVARITRKISLMNGVVPYYLTSLSSVKVKYMKGSEDDLAISPLMDTVPETPEEMEKLRYGVYHNALVYGSLVSIDAKSAIIIADFFTGEEIRLDQTTPPTIYREIEKIVAPERDDNTIIAYSGTPIIIGWVSSEGMKWLGFSAVGFLIVIGVILGLIFKSFRGVFLPILLGVISCIWAFGLQKLLFGEILRSASGFLAPFILLAAASCHSIQFFKRFQDEEYPRLREAKEAVVATFGVLFAPMLISLLTDFAGFAILFLIPFSNVSTLGSIVSLGLLSLTSAMIIFLVPLIYYFPGTRIVPKAKLVLVKGTQLLEKLAVIVAKKKVRLAALSMAGILLAISLIVLPQLDMGQDNTYAIHNFLTKSWKDHPIYIMEKKIKEKFKGIYPLNILIETKKPDGMKDPEVLKKMSTMESFLTNKFPEVAGCMDLSVYIKLMNRFMHAEDPQQFKVPDEERAIADYLFLYSLGFPGSFDSVVDPRYQNAVMSVFVDNTGQKTVTNILREAKEYVRNNFNDDKVTAKVGGGAIGIAGAFNETIRKWLSLTIVFNLLACIAIVSIIFRSFWASIFLIVSPILASLTGLIILYLSGVELNSNTSTVVSMGIGIGIDAGVYLLFRFREEFNKVKDVQEALKISYVTSGKANIFAFGALIIGCWSVVPLPFYVGYVGYGMGLVIFLNLLFTFTVFPALCITFKPKFFISKQ